MELRRVSIPALFLVALGTFLLLPTVVRALLPDRAVAGRVMREPISLYYRPGKDSKELSARDPWGHPWVYSREMLYSRGMQGGVLAYSSGPNGIPEGGEGDDVHPRLDLMGVSTHLLEHARELGLAALVLAGLSGWIWRNLGTRTRGSLFLCCVGALLLGSLWLGLLLYLERLVSEVPAYLHSQAKTDLIAVNAAKDTVFGGPWSDGPLGRSTARATAWLICVLVHLTAFTSTCLSQPDQEEASAPPEVG